MAVEPWRFYRDPSVWAIVPHMKRLVLSTLVFVAFCGLLGCNSCSKKEEPKNVQIQPLGSGMAGVSTATNPECTKLCRAVGKCSFREGKCYASSEHDCRVSFGCRTAGYCTVHEDKCAAMSDADCAGAEVCKLSKKCAARDGRCEEAAPSTSSP